MLSDTPGRVLVMLSGGGDSVALLHVSVRAKGAGAVEALHVNYGLRDEAALDERLCVELCDELGVRLHIHHAELPPSGNLHANARDARYRQAMSIAEFRGLDLVATAHTADDQAETVIYRLASSPGRRALTGMPQRDGQLIRPLLGVRRSELRAYLREQGIEWREDSSNDDPRFARARVRRVMADLEGVHRAAVRNINASAESMRVEEEAVRALVIEKLAAMREPDGSVAVAGLAALHPAVAALAMRELAEDVTQRYVPVSRQRLAELLALAARGGTRHLDLGGGAVAEVAYGKLRVFTDRHGRRGDWPGAAELAVGAPGSHEFHGWHIEVELLDAETGDDPGEPTESPDFAVDLRLTADAARMLRLRSRRRGDRLRPRGLGGSKSLQDLFVDRKVPREQRDAYPVLCSGDEILWVPGVAVGEGAATAQAQNGASAGQATVFDRSATVAVRVSAKPPAPLDRAVRR